MRRTLGRPASATSMGMAMPVSSSSAPMAGFWTITLKTGAERSGNTSRGSSSSHEAPITVPAAITSTARSGRANVPRMTRPTRGRLPASVLMMLTLTTRFLGLGLQQERALNNDHLARLKPLDDFDLTAKVSPSTDRANLERPLTSRHEHGPTVVEPLERRRRHGDNHGASLPERQPRARRHAWTQHA